MTYARSSAGGLSELVPGTTITSTHTHSVNGAPVTEPTQFSFETMLVWSDAERAAQGIFPIVEDAIPEGQRATGSSLELGDGVVHRRYTLETIPLAEIAARVQSQVVSGAQERLDAFARTRGYDGILSACTYVTSGVASFAAEGAYCVAQRDATWAALYSLLAAVEAGTRAMPGGFAEIEAELPALEWPSA